jgi:hypothetical protein
MDQRETWATTEKKKSKNLDCEKPETNRALRGAGAAVRVVGCGPGRRVRLGTGVSSGRIIIRYSVYSIELLYIYIPYS